MKRRTVELLVETLRLRGRVAPETLQQRWATAELSGLMALLKHEGADIWFSRRVQQLSVSMPEPFRSALRASVRGTAQRNLRIDAQTLTVTAMLTDAQIPCVLIKGQARRAAEARYPMANARPISDVDLLVSNAQIDVAWQMLCDRGFKRIYEAGEVDWVVHHHLPTVIDDSKVSVELHRTLNDSIAPEEAWRRATESADTVSWMGAEVRVPNATELVWQAMSHGAADGPRGYYLRTFLSVAAVLAEVPSIDWSVIEARIQANEIVDHGTGHVVERERVYRWLTIAAAFAGVDVPPRLRPKRPATLANLLTWRSRVLASSFSVRVQERLLAEAVRLELGMRVTPSSRHATPWRRMRSAGTSALWRTCYVTSRLVT
jgi:hypothetical protein